MLAIQPARSRAEAGLHLPAGVLQAGESVAVEWRDLPAGVHEVELELSLDGGRWVRISPELEAYEGRWRWRVPSMPTSHARLRLRAGGRTESGIETEEVAAVSAEFAIASEAASLGTEWWHVGEHRAPSARLDSGVAEHWSASNDTMVLAPEPNSDAPAPSPQSSGRLDPRATDLALTVARHQAPHRTRSFPLRN